MKEDLQIKIAAGLADRKAPENISGDRARTFVAKTVGQKKTIPFAVWGGSVIAVAACVLFAVILFSPNDTNSYGTPSELMEMHSIHADISQVDSTIVDSLDTTILTIEKIEE